MPNDSIEVKNAGPFSSAIFASSKHSVGSSSPHHQVKSVREPHTSGYGGGRKIHGVKIYVARDKYRIPPAIDVSPANRHDMKAIVPVLRALADSGFRVRRSGISATGGQRLAQTGETLGITVETITRGRDGQFVSTGIRWAEYPPSRARSPKVPRKLALEPVAVDEKMVSWRHNSSIVRRLPMTRRTSKTATRPARGQ